MSTAYDQIEKSGWKVIRGGLKGHGNFAYKETFEAETSKIERWITPEYRGDKSIELILRDVLHFEEGRRAGFYE